MDYSERKRIALLMAQPEEYSQNQFLLGFQKKCFELNYDVCIFAMYIKYQNSSAKEIGESSIYSLISYDKFDAVVVMGDTIQTPGAVDKLEEDIKAKFNGPVLFVDRESKYFPSIHIDNINPIKKVVSHLIDVHGIKDIAYLSGKQWHPHSIARVNAYKSALEEHGLTVDEDKIFYGDFWYSSGESLARDFIKNDNMPRAIACANDCMALGFARIVSENGIRVPEDVAIIGYDTNEEGKHSPIPMTSAPIPSMDFGEYAVTAIDELLNDKEIEPFEADVNLFIGGTCGCGCDSAKPSYELREKWESDYSMESVFSLFNHMEDDLISSSSLSGVISTLFSNTAQLRNFQSFDLILNPHRENNVSGGFESSVLHAISCGADPSAKSDKISYNRYFPASEMLPKIYEEREKPAAFFFMPLYFDDRVFGYSVISYGERPASITAEYRAWMKAASRGFEFYRRGDDLIRSSQLVEDGIITDTLTGLNNYRGFISRAENFLNVMHNNAGYAAILALDIKELSKINQNYGRSEGDKSIVAVASLLKSTFNTANCLCFCVGNGEMVAIKHSRCKDENDIVQDKNILISKMEEYNRTAGDDPHLHIHYGICVGEAENVDDLENLVSTAINNKNSFKLEAQKVTKENLLSPEEQAQARVVQGILNDNKIAYHFQPIVSAQTGDIYSYEALMRAQVSPYLIPPVVLKYAEFFGRLYDVEKGTFNNVLKIMKQNKELFAKGRKVFINSIPGQRLKGEDFKVLEEAMSKLPDSVVVELTEQTEMSDSELHEMTAAYNRIGIETALDDYGTGYSNVTNLLRYMPRYVKIDRELVSGIEDSPQKQHFVREIIDYCHSNNIFALAEGVETSEEVRVVIELGVDLLQGYYIARPQAEFLEAIPQELKDEIVRYASGKGKMSAQKVYAAGSERNINLSTLVEEKYTHLLISNNNAEYKDLIISGNSDRAPIEIYFDNGYDGTVIIEGINIGKNDSNVPAIIISGRAKPVFEVRGDNYLNGSIRVDSDSAVDIRGEGHIHITVSGDEFYGIGNNMASDCGEITLSAGININGKGNIGVGIGAGGDAKINLKGGEYSVNTRGDKVACIGSINGDAAIRITECALNVDYSGRTGTGAGSVYGDTNIYVRNVGYNGFFRGDSVTAFGTVDGRKAKIDVRDGEINLEMRAEYVCAIGSSGDLCQNILIYRENVCLKSELYGVRKIPMGNARGTAKIEIIGD